MMKKIKKFFSFFTTLALLFNIFAPSLVIAQDGGNPGAIWTTKNDCGDESQDVNHFNQGEGVFVNGSGFSPGVYNWTIKGKPGGASGDPGVTVASGVETVDDTGSFCIDDPIPAYAVASDDWGEYHVDFEGKGDNYRVPRSSDPGSITVCKVIVDPSGIVVDGNERPGAGFSISWDGSDASIGPSEFSTALNLNTSLFGDSADGECITYDQLPIGNYYYGEEVYPATGWEIPLYNDFFDPQPTGLGDFTPYFDKEDPNRNMNSDGHIVLTEGNPHRTLAVLNQYQRIPDPTRIIVHKVTDPQDDGQTPFGVTLVDVSGAPISDEKLLTTSSSVEFVVDPGIYSVNETSMPEGWDGNDFDCQDLDVVAEETEECTIYNTKRGTIQGTKYYDENGNGIHDYINDPFEDQLLNGWTIRLYDDQWAQIDETITSTLGNAGQYRFTKSPGVYNVCEVVKDDWTQSGPLSGASTIDNNHNPTPNGTAVANGSSAGDEGDVCWQINLEAGEKDGWLKFGNYELGSIFGKKWNDGDGNIGTIADRDPVQGWTIELWEELLGYIKSDTTKTDGSYSFTGLLMGDYEVKEEQKANWINLSPLVIQIPLVPGQVSENNDFTNFMEGHISGHKWHDLDGNGNWDNGEPAIEGWRIYLERPDGSIISDLTSSSGYYYFGDLGPGEYRVFEKISENPGWVQTAPAGNEYVINMTSNAVELDNPNYDFGNYEKGSITVIKNLDSDGDGELDIFRTDRFNWTINGRGDFKTGATHPLAAGIYEIEEIQVPGYHETGFYCIEKEIRDHNISVGPGENVICVFENTRDTGDIYGSKFNDLDGEGDWDDGEPGLGGWVMYLYKNDEPIKRTLTDRRGNFSFIGVPTGNYKVCEVQQDGWDQTYPGGEGDGCYDIRLTTRGVRGIDFGNWERIFDISIEKSNDKPDSTTVGETVEYTLTLTNNGNRVLVDPQIIDALPGGFTYVLGSSTVESVPVSDPTEVDGKLVWDLEFWGVKPQTSLTLVYQATIDSDVADGIYTNLATCKAREWMGQTEIEGPDDVFTVLRRIFNPESEENWIDCENIADSSVGVGTNLDFSASVEGQVLGAATELPAAGNETGLLLGFIALMGLGVGLKIAGRKYEN